MFHERQCGLIDVCALKVPARRKAGFVQNKWPIRIRDHPVMMTDHEVARSLADVDAVVAVCSMANDPFVLFIECVHRRPCEGDPRLQFARIGRQVAAFPRASRCALFTDADGVPGCKLEIAMALKIVQITKIKDMFVRFLRRFIPL